MFFLLVTLSMTLLALYFSVRLIWPLQAALWIRLPLCLLVLALGNRMTILYRLFPRGEIMVVPDIILILLAWLHIIVIIGALLTLILDIISIVLLIFGYKIHIFASPVYRFGTACGLALIFASLGIYGGLKSPQVVETDVPVRNLPADLNGFRIGFLADLHLGAVYGRNWAENIVRLTNSAAPDMIVIVGDVVDGTREELKDILPPLSDLYAPHGVWGVVGNHEYYSGLDDWLYGLPELGIRLLYNEHALIQVNKATIVLAGLPDRVSMSHMPGEKPDLAKALNNAPSEGDVIRILLDHQPGGAYDHARQGIDLQFSGHTHGGVAKPVKSFIASFNRGFVSGLYNVEGMSLLITNGAGMWAGMPFRLGVPSQIIMARLRPAP